MIHASRWKNRFGLIFVSSLISNLVLSLISLLIFINPAHSQITVVDDGAHTVRLSTAAKRVVSLAPHITELLFAAGAGHTVVGVSAWSDYPAVAKKLPIVADGNRLDLERIIDLKPDLIIAWKSGNNTHQIKRLKKLGLTIFESEPRSFDDIATSIERFAKLTGASEGTNGVKTFRENHERLKQRYAGKKTIRIFYQIWPSPLMTLNDKHLVAEIFQLCGAVNIFGKLVPLTPSVSTEAVAKANPDAILMTDTESSGLDRWRALPEMKATRFDNLFSIDGTLVNRAGPRVIEGATQLCEKIEMARDHLHIR
jgi:iron complex transport system substrate-binding protein